MNGDTSSQWVWVLIALVLAMAAVAYFGVERLADVSTGIWTSVSEERDRNRIREKIEREVAAIMRETDKKNKEAYENAMADLIRINPAFDRAEEGIKPVADDLASFKGCVFLCYLMSKDKLSGTCETEERIQSVIDAHILKNVLYAGQRVENTIARLNDALARNTTDMQVRLASMTETVLSLEDETTQAAFRDLIARINSASQKFDSIAVSTVVSGSGLVISALLVKTTVRQAKNVLWHIARRLGQTTALALSAAAADGSFPIGDAIGLVLEVGGAAWCAYALYKAQFVLRNQVAGDLRMALVQYRRDILDLGKKESLELLKAYHSRNLKIAQNMRNQLS